MATEITSLPDNYNILDVLGEGQYGKVVGCYKRDTDEVVAVKFFKKTRFSQYYDRREMFILEKLRHLDPDQVRIIKCLDWYHGSETAYMVFEKLDISLQGFMARRKWAPLPFDAIRTIIKDLATALAALKSVGLIHTDLKLANIMLVDHQTQPFRVKLIDFGLALEKSETWAGQGVQPLLSRSPEVILGHPFSEAIDVWALGTIMARLSLGFSLFPGIHEYDVLRYIIDLLGEVPKKLLKAGKYTAHFYRGRANFFMNTEWTRMTPGQFSKETGKSTQEHRAYQASSLNELKGMHGFRGNTADEADRRACFDLLEKMLQIDPKKRITPDKILAHPFITGSYLRPGKGCTMSTVVDVSESPAETKVDDCPQVVKEKSNSPKVEESNCPKDEESNSPKDEESNCSKDEESNCPKDEESNSPKDEKAISPKDEESNPPKDEKANSPKDVESNSPKDEDARDSKSVSDSTDSSLSSKEDSTSEDSDSTSEDSDSTSEDSYSLNEDSDSVIIPSAPQYSPESSQTPAANEPKKKKKRGIRRFLSILKRKVFCCFCAPKNDDD